MDNLIHKSVLERPLERPERLTNGRFLFGEKIMGSGAAFVVPLLAALGVVLVVTAWLLGMEDA